MTLLYGRINLSLTNYKILDNFKILPNPDYDQLKEIYYCYCHYKKFKSIMPFFSEHYQMPNREIIGYYDNNKLVAYSLILKYPSNQSVLADQFAWNYENPKLRLGVRSLENECRIYKDLGYHYMYLGEHSEYKSKLLGYELVGI